MEDNQNFNLENSQEEATENLISNGNGEQVAKILEEEKEENPHFIIVLRRVFIVLTVLIFILNVALYIFFSSCDSSGPVGFVCLFYGMGFLLGIGGSFVLLILLWIIYEVIALLYRAYYESFCKK